MYDLWKLSLAVFHFFKNSLVGFHFFLKLTSEISISVWNLTSEFYVVFIINPTVTREISTNTQKSHSWVVKFQIEIPLVLRTRGISIWNFTTHSWDFFVFVEIPLVPSGIYNKINNFLFLSTPGLYFPPLIFPILA